MFAWFGLQPGCCADCHFYQWRRSFLTPTLCLLCAIGDRVVQATASKCNVAVYAAQCQQAAKESLSRYVQMVDTHVMAVLSGNTEITTLNQRQRPTLRTGERSKVARR
jgi:hypothetical protein